MVELDGLFTTQEVADMLGVSARSVANWVEQGAILAAKTPGGHRRITARNVLEFARSHGLPMPAALAVLAEPKVLVVDDDPQVVHLIKAGLERQRDTLRVHTTSSGVDALVMVGQIDPDVIVLDLRLPGIDGYEVCRRLRSNPATAGLKIVAITGDESAQEAEVLAAGADRFLRKPVTAKELVKTFDSMLPRAP